MHVSIGLQRRGHSRGDTMVEVLIAIAVVTLILGGAYVTTNRSLQATRAAQERSIALKLAESQIERLKNKATTEPSAVFGVIEPFCISGASGNVEAATHDDCTVGADGLDSEDEPIFSLSIVRSGYEFVLTEEWTNVNGTTTDSLQLRYRVYD
jgi:prepilin-type N-terminal cleavage/methylation domain-containing protein